MKGPGLTNTPPLQILPKHNYSEYRKIIKLKLKINFYNLKSNLFKKLDYNKEINRFYNKNLQIRYIILYKHRRMRIYHPMKILLHPAIRDGKVINFL